MDNQQQVKWWMNGYLVGTLLLFFFPIGLILLAMKAYRDPRANPIFGRNVMIISTLFFLTPFISLILNMMVINSEEVQKSIQNYGTLDYMVIVVWVVIGCWIIHLGNKIRKGKPLQYQTYNNFTNEESISEEQRYEVDEVDEEQGYEVDEVDEEQGYEEEEEEEEEAQTVSCKNCGATNHVIEGGECEYCGTLL